MTMSTLTISSNSSTQELDASPAPDLRPSALIARTTPTQQILSERWPTLSRAMGRYQQNIAESFTRESYDAIQAGIIRLQDRQALAARAAHLGIRDFDAQLLIACAIRQWAIDHRYSPDPSPRAPKLSFEYRAWSRNMLRFAIAVGLAVALDALILAHWLS